MRRIIRKIYHICNYIYHKLFKRPLSQRAFDQFLKHSFVGGLDSILDYIIFNLLVYLGISISIANAIDHVLIFLFTFILHKFFTYEAKHHSIWQPILFLASDILYYFVETLLLIFLIDMLSLSPLLAKFLTIALLAPFSFCILKYIVFRKKD